MKENGPSWKTSVGHEHEAWGAGRFGHGIVTVTGEVATTGTIPYKHGRSFMIVVPQEVAAG